MAKRKFAYMHPVFGGRIKSKNTSNYENSVYYYWWAFLRLNEDYKQCCTSGGVGKLSKLYDDFGDVFFNDFKEWWTDQDRGARLFAENTINKRLDIVTDTNVETDADVLLIQVPLTLPKKYLITEFRKLLIKHHRGKRGYRTNANSTAKYPITGHVDIRSLKSCLDAYQMRIEYPNKTLWQIARDIPDISATTLGKSTINLKQDAVMQQRLANISQRLITKAKKIIEGTSEGKFPVLR